jgi:indolepyruvate ferredoxin oxidoreductase, beta subunit
MNRKCRKILIAGVGGQGIVYLTNIIAEAAMLSNIPVSVSEIHGLSQRGGVVTAGIGLGKYCTGFTGKASVDFLIGLEPLETQRSLPFLHKNSSVLFSDYRIAPYAVNAGNGSYPDMDTFVNYLEEECKEVTFVREFPGDVDSVLYNLFLLGRACRMRGFPLSAKRTEQALLNTVSGFQMEKSLQVFRKGLAFRNKKLMADQR